MLGNSMRKYVMGEKANGYTKEVRSVYNYRVRKYAIQALKDLALLAQKLPEDQQAEIFNEQNMRDLFRAILKLPNTLINDELLQKQKRQRLLPICYELITLLDDSTFCHLIAPTVWPVMRNEKGQLPFLRGVYYRSMWGPNPKSYTTE